MRLTWIAPLLLVASLLGPSGIAHARAEESLSPEMRAISVQEQKGTTPDSTLEFRDETGKSVSLGSLLGSDKPVLLSLNYFRCKVICSVQLQNLASSLAKVELLPGRDFHLVSVSIDPRETPEDAARKQTTLLAALDKPDAHWSLWTGEVAAIKLLAAQLGIGYAYDAEQDQYAHPAVAVFLAPDGRIVQYLYGLGYEPRDLKLALLEAGEGKIGSTLDQVILSCFHYDADIGRYGPFAFGIMRLGGGLTLLILGATLVALWRRDRGAKAEAVT